MRLELNSENSTAKIIGLTSATINAASASSLEELKNRVTAIEVKNNSQRIYSLEILSSSFDQSIAAFFNNFKGWTDWDNRFGAGTFDRTVIGSAVVNENPTIYFANNNTITQVEADAFYAAQDRGSADRRAGLVT